MGRGGSAKVVEGQLECGDGVSEKCDAPGQMLN